MLQAEALRNVFAVKAGADEVFSGRVYVASDSFHKVDAVRGAIRAVSTFPGERASQKFRLPSHQKYI